jgi:hypothetical protein
MTVELTKLMRVGHNLKGGAALRSPMDRDGDFRIRSLADRQRQRGKPHRSRVLGAIKYRIL